MIFTAVSWTTRFPYFNRETAVESPDSAAVSPQPPYGRTITTAPRLSLTPAGPTSAVRPLGKMAVPICHPRMPDH